MNAQKPEPMLLTNEEIDSLPGHMVRIGATGERDITGGIVAATLADRDAKIAALTKERDEYKRLYTHRGEALKRPCIHCGNEPKVIHIAKASAEFADATPEPLSKEDAIEWFADWEHIDLKHPESKARIVATISDRDRRIEALQAEVSALNTKSDLIEGERDFFVRRAEFAEAEVAALKARVETLEKAGDAMAAVPFGYGKAESDAWRKLRAGMGEA